MALTQSQLVSAVAERADLSKTEAKRALAALDEVVLEEIGNAQKVRIGGRRLTARQISAGSFAGWAAASLGILLLLLLGGRQDQD